jgi:N,N-dimethylformamidase
VNVVGYADRLSARPGDTIRFMVSCDSPSYRAELVRLGRGARVEADAPFREEVVAGLGGSYPGEVHELRRGSCAVVPPSDSLDALDAFTLEAWIFPTTPGSGPQGLLTRWSEAEGAGYGLFLDEQGAAALWLGDGTGRVQRVSTGAPLPAARWAFVAARFDGRSAAVSQSPHPAWASPGAREAERPAEVRPACRPDTPFLLAAASRGPGLYTHHFNGKLDAPRIAGTAEWDLGAGVDTCRVVDRSGNGNHGTLVGLPVRGATGHDWTGRETSFTEAPAEYGAIHFHDDDLDDAGWPVGFELELPADLRSGVYAARITAAGGEDRIPFFVRPRTGAPTAAAALLAPTFSYLAYANEHQSWSNPLVLDMIESPEGVDGIRRFVSAEDRYVVRERLLSLYDTHSDGTGVCYSSRLRPLANVRPGYVFAVARAPHQFPADLELVAWLEERGHAFDVVTDEDLHHEGLALLAGYRVVLTGTHPEYWSGEMLDALEAYVAGGGRVMYLGGNGLYWVTSVHPARPHVVEVRRGQAGTRTCASAPGEGRHASTGEPGGLWRYRGRAPQRLLGVGFSAQGLGPAQPYRRLPDSRDERAAFAFEGVPDDAAIGASGSVLGGAAGFEIDRLDHALGTPLHALRLATADGFSDAYQAPVEEILMSDSRQGGSVNELVRADLVYTEYPGGGAVFSTGSIAWCGSLATCAAVARITENVLERFAGGAGERPAGCPAADDGSR